MEYQAQLSILFTVLRMQQALEYCHKHMGGDTKQTSHTFDMVSDPVPIHYTLMKLKEPPKKTNSCSDFIFISTFILRDQNDKTSSFITHPEYSKYKLWKKMLIKIGKIFYHSSTHSLAHELLFLAS